MFRIALTRLLPAAGAVATAKLAIEKRQESVKDQRRLDIAKFKERYPQHNKLAEGPPSGYTVTATQAGKNAILPEALWDLQERALTITDESKRPQAVHLIKADTHQKGGDTAVFVGDLVAMMQSLRHLSENPLAKVTIITNGDSPSIAMRSGTELHTHPTQHAELDLFGKLFPTLFRSLDLSSKETEPTDPLYSHMHFNTDFRGFNKEGAQQILNFLDFTIEAIKSTLTPIREADRNLVKLVNNSINFIEALDKDIKKVLGPDVSIMDRKGRIYLFPKEHRHELEEKLELWNELGIEAEFVDEDYIKKHTLLKPDTFAALKVTNDGQLNINYKKIIIEYINKKYEGQVQFVDGNLETIGVNPATENPVFVTVQTSDDTKTIPTKSVFASLGHNQVLDNGVPIYSEIPVTGATTDWSSTFDVETLLERFQLDTVDALVDYIKDGNILPLADMRNFHSRVHSDVLVKDGKITVYYRGTLGASVDSWTVDPRDILSVAYKTEEYMIGKPLLLSQGFCTRKTSATNHPGQTSVGGNILFTHSLSGIGVSASAGPLSSFAQSPYTLGSHENIFQKLAEAFCN